MTITSADVQSLIPEGRFAVVRIGHGYYVADSTGHRVTEIMHDAWADGAMIHPGAKKRARKIARRWNARVA